MHLPIVYHLFLTLLGITQSNTQPSSVECGKQAPGLEPDVSETPRIRLIGGHAAKPHSWPWVVVLHATGECGGTILRVKANVEASDTVLTAAHCITLSATRDTSPQLVNVSIVSVVAGVHSKSNSSPVTERAVALRIHPNFKRFRNDIALVKLANPIAFTDFIRPVCLPEQREQLPLNKTCATAGWGVYNAAEGATADQLQQLVYPVQSDQQCATAYNGGSWKYNSSEMLCAGFPNSNAGTALGDSGGMLACIDSSNKWTQYGVNSFGNKPDVYARVSSYVTWIKDTIKNITSL